MSKRIQMVGQKYGMLTVTAQAWNKTRGRVECTSTCDCGKVGHIADAQNVRTGNTTSCGCHYRTRLKGEKSSWFTGGKFMAEFRRQRDGAAKRGLDFTLTEDQTALLFSQPCFYCGQSPKLDNRKVLRNGIDRQDNSRGYVWENVVSCCGDCNRMKSAYSAGEFQTMVARIYKNLFS